MISEIYYGNEAEQSRNGRVVGEAGNKLYCRCIIFGNVHKLNAASVV